MKLDAPVIKMLSEKSGKNLNTPDGADFLRIDIEEKLGERISLNSVKRLLGLLPYESTPRASTLEIIARYLGFSSWNLLRDFLNGKVSDFNIKNNFIEMNSLPSGCKVVIKWNPNREILIRHSGNGEYIVEKAQNSKLLEDDHLFLSQIAVGFPLMVKEVVRTGKSLGNYLAAQTGGISYLEVLNG